MSTDYVPSAAAFPSPIVVPDENDDATAASVNAAFEALADQLAYVKARQPQFLSTVIGSNYVSASTAYAEIAELVIPAPTVHLFVTAVIRARVGNTGPANGGTIRLRASSAFGTAGTVYAESERTIAQAAGSSLYVVSFATSVSTGTKLYLEGKVDLGSDSLYVLTNSVFGVMAVPG